MKQVGVRNAIQSQFLQEFNGEFPIELDNQKGGTPPDNSDWVRLSVRFRTGMRATLGARGNRKFTRSGVATVQVFVPIETATDTIDELSQRILDHFDGETLGQLWFTECDIRSVGPSGKWFQTNVILPFNFEDIK